MSDDKTFEEAVQAIHRPLEEAEHQLSQLGDRLQFLIGPGGEIEIARRGPTGETLRPKVVIARLAGCDAMLWRPDYPAWVHTLDPGRDAGAVEPGPPSGSPPGDAGSETEGGGEPPAVEDH